MKFDMCFNNINNMQFNGYIFKIYVIILSYLMRLVSLGYNLAKLW